MRLTARSITSETSNCSVAVRLVSLQVVVPQPESASNSTPMAVAPRERTSRFSCK